MRIKKDANLDEVAVSPHSGTESEASVKTSRSFVITDPKEISKKSEKVSEKKEVNFINVETLTAGTATKVTHFNYSRFNSISYRFR